NSDGIDPSSSKNVSILYSYIRAGDDNVAIKASASGPAEHITVAHNHFYAGHGMSIGSETQGGVTAVRVTDLTIDGADNGIRIKSNPTRGGLVHDVGYEDVCIRGVKNPLVMETTYEGQTAGTLIPRFEEVALHNVRVLGGGKIAIAGFDLQHPVHATFDGVVLSGVRPDQVQVANAKLATGPGQVNFAMSGPGVEIVKLAGDHKVLSCDGRFVPFPGSAPAAEKNASTAARSQVVVATDGSGTFRSLQAAVDALPESGGIITIRPGVYRETVRITKPNVRFEGPADPSQVVIVFDKSAATSGGTLNSATVDISGDDFSARGLTFENDFSKRGGGTPNQGGQAIALAVSGDRAGFQHVRILGAQDTLFVGSKGCVSEQGPCTPARQYFSDCYVEGHVDFIFGDAKAVFSHCEIHAIARNTVYLTAQSRHYAGQESGFVFDHCKVTADADAKSIWMGRPWRPFATVVFLNTDIQATIEPAGWREWHPGETHSLDTAFYAEYHSVGSGATGPRDPHTHILSDAEAQQFLPAKFLAGPDAWNPEVPRQVAHATAGEKQ
ncbi:MAG TPA: pectinesterase family protein, partial [Terriglobales bacterium]|nr:pectinesterase family protein [Terriglobales bacterium]